MRKSIRYLLLTFGILVFALNSFAQKHAQSDADKAFNNGAYYKAIVLYKKALGYISNQHIKGAKKIRANIMFQIAECYRLTGDFKHDIEEYGKAIKGKCDDTLAAKQYIE